MQSNLPLENEFDVDGTWMIVKTSNKDVPRGTIMSVKLKSDPHNRTRFIPAVWKLPDGSHMAALDPSDSDTPAHMQYNSGLDGFEILRS